MNTTILKGPVPRGRLRKLQEEVHKEMSLLKGQRGPNNSLAIEKEKQKETFLYESGGSHDEGHMSVHSLSSRSQRSERHKRHDTHMRVRKEPRREDLDGIKCKIPQFLGDCKPDSYLN
ncbi:hypothetical protein CR513_52004, partial [Mucuna pruriens]